MPTENVTNINAIGLVFTLFMGFLMLVLPRRLALIPLVLTACFITLGQVIVIGGLHFSIMRILVGVGWTRLLIRREIKSIRFNALDKVLIWYVISSIVAYTLLWQTSEAFINRLGLAYNAVGMYFMFRFFIVELSDIKRLITVLAIIIVPLVIAVFIEKVTGRNIFSVFGGVQEFSEIRNGEIRAQGPFAHPILMGTFAASLVPLFIAIGFRDRRTKAIAIVGITAATIMTVIAHSSGPVMAYLFGGLGVAMWPLRRRMKVIRWVALFSLIALHLVMKAPVWALFGRLSEISGGTGWHRTELINQCISYFGEWWLLGTKSTAHWGEGLTDLTSEYVRVGVEGGFITLILLIVLIVLSFKSVGRTVRLLESKDPRTSKFFWCIGASLFAHVVSFLSVSYFDQIILFWYLLLAMISTGNSLVGVLPERSLNRSLGQGSS